MLVLFRLGSAFQHLIRHIPRSAGLHGAKSPLPLHNLYTSSPEQYPCFTGVYSLWCGQLSAPLFLWYPSCHISGWTQLFVSKSYLETLRCGSDPSHFLDTCSVVCSIGSLSLAWLFLTISSRQVLAPWRVSLLHFLYLVSCHIPVSRNPSYLAVPSTLRIFRLFKTLSEARFLRA